MTSATSDHLLPNLPAWYRLLPKPQNGHNPTLRRTSSLAQHHLVQDRYQDQPASVEDGGRRNTVHVSDRARSKSTFEITQSYIGASQQAADGGSGSASPVTRGHSVEMADTQSHPPPARIDSNPRENICLCPASPKIPRPRNSFILFRQHQQASIIAQNPGIPNPEVSKIIGEQWRGLTTEAKEEWNLLAEEEKARHQQQYPGYRYHPRRHGRASNQSSVSGPSSAEPQEPCTKCGGKPMNYYSNPAPIYTPPASAAQQTMAVSIPAKRGYVVSAAPPGQRIHGQAVSPEHVGFQRVDPRLVYTVPSSSQPIRTPPSAESQDSKRRRLGNGVYIPAREVYPEATYSYAHSPVGNGTYVRQEIVQHPSQMLQHVQVPKPQMVSPPRNYPCPPALQPIRPPHPHQRNRSSVALPSIETMVSQTPTKATSAQFQSSGVEAMIRSIPVLNKIKVLSQLSGSLSSPGLTSPKPDVRGAIIAVEGMDATSVNSMTNSLAEQLEKEGKFAVKIFGGPDPYTLMRDAKTGAAKKDPAAFLDLMSQWHKISKEMVEYITTRPGTDATTSPMQLDQHDVSPRGSQITEDIPHTTDKTVRIEVPAQHTDGDHDLNGDKLDSAISPKTILKPMNVAQKSPLAQSLGHKGRSLSTPGSWTNNESGTALLDTRPPPPLYTRPPNSTRIPPPPAAVSNTAPVPSSNSVVTSTNAADATITLPPPPAAPIASPMTTAIPIAIVPHFQLTTVDASSISLPINDSFSPPAHWQWFAAMWRGSVGPDITIVIRGVDEDPAEGSDVAKPAPLPGVGPTGAVNGGVTAKERVGSVASSAQSHSGGTGVEIRLHDSKAGIVRTGIFGSSSATSSLAMGHAEDKAVSKSMTPAQHAKEMENWEKAKRRVGFEVEEFLRR